LASHGGVGVGVGAQAGDPTVPPIVMLGPDWLWPPDSAHSDRPAAASIAVIAAHGEQEDQQRRQRAQPKWTPSTARLRRLWRLTGAIGTRASAAEPATKRAAIADDQDGEADDVDPPRQHAPEDQSRRKPSEP